MIFRAALVAICLGTAGCTVGPSVARVSNGTPLDGRWISPEAYAAFLEGALLEARGDDTNAAAAYERALAEDPRAPEVWARLGAVRCRTDRHAASSAFDHAAGLDATAAAPWLARAKCDLLYGDGKAASAAALRAAALSPDDLDATLVSAAAFERAGDPVRSGQWLHAAVLRWPGAAEAVRAFREHALKHGDFAAAGRASASLARLRDDASASDARRELDFGNDVDRALAVGDLDAIRDAQIRARLGSAELALRAVESGRLELAKEIAARVLAAEPENVDARVVVLVAADLEHDEVALKKTLERLPHDRRALDPDGVALVRALLARRAGSEAANAWAAAWGVTGKPTEQAPDPRR